MKYATEMLYVPNFINIGSGIEKLMGGGYGDRMVVP
jgi:hypothetical protein